MHKAPGCWGLAVPPHTRGAGCMGLAVPNTPWVRPGPASPPRHQPAAPVLCWGPRVPCTPSVLCMPSCDAWDKPPPCIKNGTFFLIFYLFFVFLYFFELCACWCFRLCNFSIFWYFWSWRSCFPFSRAKKLMQTTFSLFFYMSFDLFCNCSRVLLFRARKSSSRSRFPDLSHGFRLLSRLCWAF